MCSIKLKEAKELRAQMQKKWQDFFDEGNTLSEEKLKEMKEDDENLAKVCKEATREWLTMMNNTE